MKNDVIKYSLILFIITVVAALLLSVTNFLTKDIIAGRLQLQEIRAREKVLGGLEYAQEVVVSDSLWKYVDKEGEVLGFATMASGGGYSGTIKIMLGLDKDLNVIGLDILEHTETPGLGSKAQAEVCPQFMGKQAPFSVVKRDAKDSEVKAISGATITTKAVVDIVNQSIRLIETNNE